MNIATVNGNFTFDELEKKVNGTYNRGELRLGSDGKLHRLNNHVWAQVFNNKSTDSQENVNVREAIYHVIAARFGGSKALAGYLKVAQEALTGSENIRKSISRDEVRAIIAQLKAVEGKDVQNAENALKAAKLELSNALARREHYAEISREMDLDSELMPADVEEDRKNVNRLRNLSDGAEAELKTAKQNYELAVGELPDHRDLDKEVGQLMGLRRSLTEADPKGTGTSAKVLALRSSVDESEQTVEGLLQKLATATNAETADSLRKAILNYGSATRKSELAKRELKMAESELSRDTKTVNRKLRVDALVRENAGLARRAKTAEPADAVRLNEQIAANKREIAKLRKEGNIDDGRAGGILTQADIDHAEELWQKAVNDVKTAEENVAAAESRLQDVRAHTLNVEDFSLLLKTIRAVKEESALVERTPDGGFKLRNEHRGFDKDIVLSGLRSGMGRETIVETATENSGRNVGAVDIAVMRLPALLERENRLQAFNVRANELKTLLTSELKKAPNVLEQCKAAGRIVLEWLRKMRSESGIRGLDSSLEPDITNFQVKLVDLLEEAERAGNKLGLKNDYRRVLNLAAECLDSVSLADDADDTEVTTAHELLRSKVLEMVDELFLDPTAVQPEAAELNDFDQDFYAQVNRAFGEKDVFKTQPSTEADFREIAAEAAKVLLDTFENLLAIGRPPFAQDLVDGVKSGDLTLDKFVTTFAEKLRSSESYPADGIRRDRCEKCLEAMSSAETIFDRLLEL